uniref:Uncharacterized protein n=1 Tax=Oryza meridionalis TaxID=40149 RepID=A0A0E0C6I5_9ORYZ
MVERGEVVVVVVDEGVDLSGMRRNELATMVWDRARPSKGHRAWLKKTSQRWLQAPVRRRQLIPFDVKPCMCVHEVG